jgi:hypothetical protein
VVLKAIQAQWVRQVLPVQQVDKEHRVYKDYVVTQVLRVQREYRVQGSQD